MLPRPLLGMTTPPKDTSVLPRTIRSRAEASRRDATRAVREGQPAVMALNRKRARSLKARMPAAATITTLAATGRPLLASTLNHAAAALRVAADVQTSDQLLLDTLNDLRPRLEEYTQSEESGNDSDCTRGCDENLEACMEHWIGMQSEEPYQMPGGNDEAGNLEQDPEGSVDLEGAGELDVENRDPGEGSGVDDRDAGDGIDREISDFVWATSAAMCTVELVVCLAACVVPG